MTSPRNKWMTNEIDVKIRLMNDDGISYRITAEVLSKEFKARITKAMVLNYCRGIGLATPRPIIRVEKDALFLKKNVATEVPVILKDGCNWPLQCDVPTARVWCDYHAGLLKQKRAA